MGIVCCKLEAKWFLLFICFLQTIFTVERQIFDFLGHMWASIVFDFISILIIIIGCFAALERRISFLVLYLFWQFGSILWNICVVCFYLNIGFDRDKEENFLNLGTGSRSWWEINGPLCEPRFNLTNDNPLSFIRPIDVKGCLLEHYVVETIQASIQLFLSLFAAISSILFIYYSDNGKKINNPAMSQRCLSSATSLPAYSIALRHSLKRARSQADHEALSIASYDITSSSLNNVYHLNYKAARNSIKSTTSSRNRPRRANSPLYTNSH